MSASRGFVLFALVAAAVGLGVPAGLFFWARWLAARPAVPRVIGFVAPAILVLALVNGVWSGLRAVSALRGVQQSLDAVSKSQMLADGIAEVMNCYAFGLLIILAVFVPLLGVLTVLSRLRWHAS